NRLFAQETDDGPGDTRRRHRRFASSRAPCDPMKREAAAKLVAGLVGLTWRLTRHTMKAKSVFGFAHATCRSPPFKLRIADCNPESIKAERIGIEPISSRQAGRRRF